MPALLVGILLGALLFALLGWRGCAGYIIGVVLGAELGRRSARADDLH